MNVYQRFGAWSGVAVTLFVTGWVAAQVSLNAVRQITIGTGGDAPLGTSGSPVFSPNGRLLAFRSDATNLVADDLNGFNDVFIADLSQGSVVRQSISASGSEGDGASTSPALSAVGADGFYALAFQTNASNLTSVISTFGSQIAVRFPTLNVTELISISTLGNAGSGNSTDPAITVVPAPNRTLIVYTSEANDLVSDDTNGETDIFLAEVSQPSQSNPNFNDLITTTRLSVNPESGVEGDGDCSDPSISGDGRYVVFATRATNLVPNLTGASQQIVLLDRQANTTSYISVSADGIIGNNDSSQPSISYSGRFITYRTLATNIIGDSVDGRQSVILYDRQTNTSRRVNRTAEGVAGNGDGATPAVSPNGRFVVFSDNSDNLVENDTNAQADVFLKDFETGAISRISVTFDGSEANNLSDIPVATLTSFNSLTGRVSFRSFADNLTESPTIGGGEIVLTEGSLPAPTLNRGERLEAPPDISLRGRRTRIEMQRFGGIALGSQISQLVAAATGQRVRYDIRIQNVNRPRVRVKLLSRRNAVTSRRLKPGTYTVRYRAQVVSNSKVVASSTFSPRQRVTVS